MEKGCILGFSRIINRRHLLGGVAFAATLPLMSAWPAVAAVEAGRKNIPLYSGLLDVAVPSELEEMPADELQKAFSAPLTPDYAFADRLRTAMLAVSIVQSPDPRVDLVAFTMQWGKALEGSLDGFKWVQRRVNRINGRPWITWQYQYLTADGVTENIMFMNILSRDVMIWVNGNAPRAIFHKRVADFEAAVRSIDGTLDVPRLTAVKLTR